MTVDQPLVCPTIKGVGPEKVAMPPIKKRLRQGKVVSNKMDKTIKVQINRTMKHKLTGKIIRSKNDIFAHDSHNEGQIGDKVLISECRPIAKNKAWVLVKILQKANSNSGEEN